MLKLAVAVLALAVAGTASAAGWRSLRVDASSEAAFEQSLALFKKKLSDARRVVFGEALKDIWIHESEAAAAEQREYATEDYYSLLHGMSYEDVVTFTDPTGETAKQRWRAASLNARVRRPAGISAPPAAAAIGAYSPWGGGEKPRGGVYTDARF